MTYFKFFMNLITLYIYFLFLFRFIVGSRSTYPSMRFFFPFLFLTTKSCFIEKMNEERLEIKILTKYLYINYRNGDSILNMMVGDALKF